MHRTVALTGVSASTLYSNVERYTDEAPARGQALRWNLYIPMGPYGPWNTGINRNPVKPGGSYRILLESKKGF